MVYGIHKNGDFGDGLLLILLGLHRFTALYHVDPRDIR